MVHEMRLHPESFEKIKNGQKTIELRLHDEKRRLIHVGDTIKFMNRANEENVITEVTYLKPYPNFKDLFSAVKDYYPSISEKEFVQEMYQYYSPKDEQQYGALEIGIQLVKE
jgi:ASC-1-like (ASCH) protein